MVDREERNGQGPTGDAVGRGSTGDPEWSSGVVDAGAEGQDDLPTESQIRCKLERADGSEWTVTELLLTPEGLFINAYRYVRERGLDAESRREVLEREPFVTTDRINCLSRRGTVRWSLSSPSPDGVIR